MELNWIMWERRERKVGESWKNVDQTQLVVLDALSAKEHWKTLEVVICITKHLTYY